MLNDSELTTLIVQPGFVEGVLPEERAFATIPEAFRFIFRNNKEYGILLWNGIPVRFSYTEDLPEMIVPLTELLTIVHAGNETETSCRFVTENFDLLWEVAVLAGGRLRIRQGCERIAGNYAQSLNGLTIIFLYCEAFLKEWKLLIAQLCEAYRRSGITTTTGPAQEVLKQLNRLDETISGHGVLYSD